MTEPRTTIVLYDDECPMCSFYIRVLSRLDWLGRLTLLPMSSPAASSIAKGITPEALEEAMHTVSPDGRVRRAAAAVRHIAIRVPLLFPLALLLWIPGVMPVAERVYRWVARNRYGLSRWIGCKQSCGITRSSTK
jgi:predicted DCC family thiol-disulfide oxidoreductase YuxK